MRLKEAIAILEGTPKQNSITLTQRGRKAIELGTEALKRLKEIREKMKEPYVATQILLMCAEPLSGETEE